MESANAITPPVAAPEAPCEVRAVYDALGELFIFIRLYCSGAEERELLAKYARGIRCTTSLWARAYTGKSPIDPGDRGALENALDAGSHGIEVVPREAARLLEHDAPALLADPARPAISRQEVKLVEVPADHRGRVPEGRGSSLPRGHKASAAKNGIPETGVEAPGTPDRAALERDLATGGERGIRTPDALAGAPDFESARPFSERNISLQALAYDLVDAGDHDPTACARACCNEPITLQLAGDVAGVEARQ